MLSLIAPFRESLDKHSLKKSQYLKSECILHILQYKNSVPRIKYLPKELKLWSLDWEAESSETKKDMEVGACKDMHVTEACPPCSEFWNITACLYFKIHL